MKKIKGDVTLIDFPQMVSTSHSNAEYYFDRDVAGEFQIDGFGDIAISRKSPDEKYKAEKSLKVSS